MALGSVGQWRTIACSRKYPFLCQKKVPVSLPSVDTYLTGVPLMSGVYTVTQASVLSTSPDPGQQRVEMMLFPGLWFSHAGQVLSVELVTQPSQHHTYAKVQILRPYCSPNLHLIPPGCSSLHNPFSCCSPVPLCNTTGGCVTGHYWCHLLESCQPVTSPCSSYHMPNGGPTFPLPPRYPALAPFYHLVADMSLSLPPSSKPAHMNVVLPEKEINVYPDDILAVQHTGQVGGFLQCLKSSDSAWRQSYLSFQGTKWGGWWEGGLSAMPVGGQWADGVVCDLRVLYADTLHPYAVSPMLSTGQNEPSGYSYMGTMSTPLRSTQARNPGQAQSPVSGLHIVHPMLDKEGRINLPINVPTFIVIKILSGFNVTSTWSDPIFQTRVPFLSSCPPELPMSHHGCERDTSDTWFSHATVVLSTPGSHILNISASNNISSQSVSVQLQGHQPVTGLKMQPHGDQRMLVDVSQVFQAMVDSGSSVKYTWVIDNLVQFAYEGQMYSVVFKKPAEYKLNVTASNPVSSQSLEVRLTAEMMVPLADPTFLSVGEVVAVNAQQLFTLRVKVDISIGITFWWDFGDNSPGVNHSFSPPLESRGSQIEQGVRQIYLQDSVSHTFIQPDDYMLRVQVFNRYDRIEKSVVVKVRSPLAGLHLSTTPAILIVNQTFDLEALPWPSPYGILYTWNFGDNSKEVKGFDCKVRHILRAAGVYNVTVSASNTLSALTSWMLVEVIETISGLQLSYSGPNELGSTTVIKGSVCSGTSLLWTFDLDNGSTFKNLTDSHISYIYKSPGNYSVIVTVANPVSQAVQKIKVEVYTLTITGILPHGCLASGQEVHLRALVTGNVPTLIFHWDFGDGTPVTIIQGNSQVAHAYSSPGSYQINVTVFSSVGSHCYHTAICVESLITAVILNSSSEAVALGKEVCFNVSVYPKLIHQHTYQFLWYNNSNNIYPGRGPSHYCFVFEEEGIHQVSVVVSNSISNKTAKALVTVQKPVTELIVTHDGHSGAVIINKTYSFWVETCSGTNVTVEWDFRDGSPRNEGKYVSHAFTSAGRYTVSITAQNAVSQESVALDVDVLVPVSSLALKIKQPVPEVGEETEVLAVLNVMNNVSFYWSVNPSIPPELGTSTFRYIFPKAGVYQIYVTAQNAVSKQEATIEVEVLERIQGLHITSESLVSMRYVPTQENIHLSASVIQGSHLSYQWQVLENGIIKTICDGEHFQLFTETPGDILVELIVSNSLGRMNSSISLRAVERISGIMISTTRDTVPVGKPVKISASVKTGTDLQHLWYVGDTLSPLPSHVPLLLHVFTSLGSVVVRVSVRNVLGSSEATKQLTVQEEIYEVNFKINHKTNPFFVPCISPVLLLGSVEKGTGLKWEWKLFMTNGGSASLGNKQSVVYSFLEAGVYQVFLNASNDISWQTVSHRVTAQDAIQGLSLNVSGSTVCAGDPIVFTPMIFKGSDVQFSLEFNNGDFLVNLVQNNFTTSNLPVGNHTVRARAWNQVSTSIVGLIVQVVEKVKGLRLVNCCSLVLESMKETSFEAEVQSKSPVMYHWIFHLVGYQPSYKEGLQVFYIPPSNGSLTVSLEASNGFCSQSLSERANIEWPVQDVRVVCNSTGIYTDFSVTFSAVTNNGSNLVFQWEFGDSAEETVITQSHTISHLYRTPGRYIVQVTVFNNISRVVAQLPIEAKRLECTRPKVSLVQKQSVILRSRPSYFEANVDLQGCIMYKTSYMWEVLRAPGCGEDDRIPLVNLTDVTTPFLMLPKRILAVGSYCLRFTACIQDTPLLQQQSIRITVVHSQLVPVIKGGSHRLWSSHRDLLLDGTESHDPDVGFQEGKLLQYHWDYIVENTKDPLPPVHSNSSILMVPRQTLRPGNVYLFTLTVQKAGRLPASTTQSVAVQQGQVLPVSVDCVSCSTLLSFHHSLPLALSGKCPSCSGITKYKWSAEGSNDELLELNEFTTSTGATGPDLVVRPGVLLDGLTYTFTLHMSQPAVGLWGSASITLLPNRPPYGGVCTLTPDTDIRLLQTVVTYACSGWVDGDSEPTQLIYTLQAEVCQDDSQSGCLLTLYKGTQHTFGTLVPLGSHGSGGNVSVITVLVKVEDNLGATVTALNRTLTVLPPNEGEALTDWLKNKSQSELWALVQRGNPQEVIPFSIALTSQLNQMQSVSEQDVQDRMLIRENVTRAVASFPVSSLRDAAQVSSALAQCTAVPGELACEGCQETVLKAVEKMIAVIGEQTEPGDVTSLDAGRNILHILGSSMAAAAESTTRPEPRSQPGRLGSSEAVVSVFGQAGELMRSLMQTRMRGEEALTLTAPRIRAVGRRSDPADLLCTEHSGPCQFHIPHSLSAQLREGREEVVQILLGFDGNNGLVPAARPPISTTLAAMEFATPQGQPIPIANLPPDRAIRVLLPSRLSSGWPAEGEGATAVNITLPAEGSLNFTVRAVDTDPHAGLFLAFNFSLLPGTGSESSGKVRIMVASQPAPTLSQHSFMREVYFSLSAESPAVEETIFLTPLQNSSGQELHVNVTSSLTGGTVRASVYVFTSLCQYFSLEQRRWSSEGLSPLSGSSSRTAHCLTQHLTIFGASLFVHPDAVVLLPPPEGPVRNVVVGIVCAVLLLMHLLIALFSHKLDHLHSTRASTVPLCGQSGHYQYRILVKTGWARGSGTTAHVGISLYGLNKSGSRHLQREGAFQRNALDDFQVETDANLGEIWKIRIWHDNTGLDPTWFLQHVVVWDKQTDIMYFFLVEDWLSVENDKNGGMVEKEVLASCPQDLQHFTRVLRTQLVCGMFERHLWVSVWECPSYSNFTRAQRVTCCALLLHLYLAVGAVWYGAVGNKETSGPVSARLLVNMETVAVGMAVSVLVFPLHLLFCFLFRKTGSKVTAEESAPSTPVSQTVEMDVYLSHPELASSSFLSLPGGMDSILDAMSHSSDSLGSKNIESTFWNASKLGNESEADPWPSCDSIFDLPELQGQPPLSHARLLKRKKALLQLRLGSPACSPEQPPPLPLSDPAHSGSLQHNLLTLSEEDLIQSIATGTAGASSTSSGRVTSDSGRYSPCETALSDTQESTCSGWSELSQEKPSHGAGLCKSPSSLSVFTTASTFLPSPSPDSLGTSSTTRIGVARGAPTWLLPSWVLGVTYLLAGLVLGGCLALVGLYGSSFSSSVLLMWLISAASACLTSALLLEPLKVCVQALFLAAVVRPVDPEVEERLGQEAAVRRGRAEHGGRVRPPCGYGLLHAKEEARKVRALRSLMKNCVVHMLFLLVVLLVNYQDSVQAVQGRLLHSAVKRSLLTAPAGMLNLSTLTRWSEAWQWMDNTLVPYLHQNPLLLLVGLPRLQKEQSQDGCCANVKDSLGFSSTSFVPVIPVSLHTPSGEQRDSALNSCSGHLLSWLWRRGQCEGHSGGGDVVELGNNTELTRQLLSGLQSTHWINAATRAVYVEFTQYHRETALFVAVTIRLEWPQADSALTSISIQPFHMPPSSSGPHLQLAMMVLLLLFALSFLVSELWAGIRQQGHCQYQGRLCLQLLVSLLSLATAVLRMSFLYVSASSLSQHGSQPQTFTNFHRAALLDQISSQLSALLLTVLVLKMVGVLRFVRRWVVFGRVLLQAWRELSGVVCLLVLLLLLFSHTGSLLFSGSVEGFRTVWEGSLTMVSALRGRGVIRRLCKRHPALGPVYCMALVGTGLWVLGRLCGAVLVRSYRLVQTEMYRPVMEPQDYEMVEFFIKRLKLWMGLSKTKGFRHKVKFEGMVSPPSRSSLGSQLSSLSAHSSPSPRLASAQSLGSEDSCLSDGFDAQYYLDRLLPAFNNLLSQFDRVNQLNDDLHGIELQLQGAQSRIIQRQKQQASKEHSVWKRSMSTPAPSFSTLSPPFPLPPSLPLFFSCNHTIPCTRTTFSETWQNPDPCKTAQPVTADSSGPTRRASGVENRIRRVPGRRAWHSGASHSADAAQRSPQALCSTLYVRPRSEEGERSLACDRVPVKRRAWHPDGPD
ncbi:polycystin-1 [Megalops cyprinoides]|uniref:polycystin-1 n=1 Tax=Megalops cyprinoides TaxID=118141 RepID=UPI0018655F35|nr:polycystin-1 [Megalops cyprinoides]